MVNAEEKSFLTKCLVWGKEEREFSSTQNQERNLREEKVK